MTLNTYIYDLKDESQLLTFLSQETQNLDEISTDPRFIELCGEQDYLEQLCYRVERLFSESDELDKQYDALEFDKREEESLETLLRDDEEEE